MKELEKCWILSGSNFYNFWEFIYLLAFAVTFFEIPFNEATMSDRLWLWFMKDETPIDEYLSVFFLIDILYNFIV